VRLPDRICEAWATLIPTERAISVGDGTAASGRRAASGSDDMGGYLQIAKWSASPRICNFEGALAARILHNASMARQAANGGPNYLADWLAFRGISQASAAAQLGLSPGMMSQLVNGRRQMTAHYLRRFAELLDCRPGDLLDFHPHDVPPSLQEVARRANRQQLQQIAAVADTIVSFDAPSGRRESALERNARALREFHESQELPKPRSGESGP